MKLLKCSINKCTRTFTRNCDLIEHENRHNNIRPFACQQCTKSYFTKNNLTVHEKVHIEKEFTCETCNSKFITDDKLKRHKKSCLKNYSCKTCNKIYVRKGCLERHEKNHEIKSIKRRENRRILHKCEICKGIYASKKTWKYHMKTQHKNDDIK